MASDGPSRDPRTQLPAAIEAALADDLDTALTGILEAGLGARPILGRDPAGRSRSGRSAAVATVGLAGQRGGPATSAQDARDPTPR